MRLTDRFRGDLGMPLVGLNRVVMEKLVAFLARLESLVLWVRRVGGVDNRWAELLCWVVAVCVRGRGCMI